MNINNLTPKELVDLVTEWGKHNDNRGVVISVIETSSNDSLLCEDTIVGGIAEQMTAMYGLVKKHRELIESDLRLIKMKEEFWDNKRISEGLENKNKS